jgi:hypothetical protein
MTDKTSDAAWAVKEAKEGEALACDISYQLYAIASLTDRHCDDENEDTFKGLGRLLIKIHDQAEGLIEHFTGLGNFARGMNREGGAE